MALTKIILTLIITLYISSSIAFAGSVTEQQAAKSVASKYNAKVLAISKIKASNKQYFKIRIKFKKDQGRVKMVYVDASTGKILERKP
ncbi:MAG: PepSY domain-containing protein [Gammaproteobacteria bacterium]|nr:PepSY domain-containing protein [Gammaproteobacteria bacterium]